MSHPTWVRGLKLMVLFLLDVLQLSHPTWVRGLKLNNDNRDYTKGGSHPTWVRGLKPSFNQLGSRFIGRTLRGCVD